MKKSKLPFKYYGVSKGYRTTGVDQKMSFPRNESYVSGDNVKVEVSFTKCEIVNHDILETIGVGKMFDLIKRVIEKINKDEKLKRVFFDYGGRSRDLKISFYTMSNAAGNHLFDDKPELFDITENEGHRIRSIFQEQHIEEKFKNCHPEIYQLLEKDSVECEAITSRDRNTKVSMSGSALIVETEYKIKPNENILDSYLKILTENKNENNEV